MMVIEGIEWVWLTGIVLGGVAASYLLLSQRIKVLEERIKRMAKRVEQLEAASDIEEPAINEELRRLIARGEEVQAIKAVRVAFGYSLVEAKHYIDGLKENS